MDAKGVRQIPVEGTWTIDGNRNGEYIFLKKNLENTEWNLLDKNNKTDLQAYLKKYPLSIHVEEANILIQKIDAERKLELEKKAYQFAKNDRTVAELFKFMRDFPVSIFYDEIKKLLAEVEEEEAWNECKRLNTISAYLDFKNRFRQGLFLDACHQRINDFEIQIRIPIDSEQIKREIEEGKKAYKDDDDIKAFRLLFKHKENDFFDAEAQFYLASMYEEGKSVEINKIEAVKWYKKAAELGNTQSQLNLGMMYEWGDGVLKDNQEAAKWYQKAAEQGNSDGLFNLVTLYENEGNYKEAIKWYQKTAEQGDAKGQFNLGNYYLSGLGTDENIENIEEAIKWFKKAADQKYANGQAFLGDMYENGTGVKEDKDEAIRLYRLAAAQENQFAIDALRRLGEKE